MEWPYENLVSLFLTLFKSSELRRFVRLQYGSRVGRLLQTKASESAQIRGLVEELVEHALVNDALFDALLERKPGDRDLIERVREQFVSDKLNEDTAEQIGLAATSALVDVEQGEEISAEQLDWRRSMEAAFDQFSSDKADKPVHWIEAAAVLPDFDPAKIRPFAKHNDKPAIDGVVKLASFCHSRTDGRWELAMQDRRAALSKLWSNGDISNALNANRHEKSLHGKLLHRFAAQAPISIGEIGGYDELLAARDIADWFTGIEVELFDVDRVHAILERYERIEPLRKLVGKHFRGRKEELAQLQTHASAENTDTPILIVWGGGGAGKSTLLGKFLLDFDDESEPSRPWAYLDFDDPAIDTTRPERLVEQIARHIGLLYADAARSGRPGGLAAWLMRRTLVIHEQNAIAGLTNRLLARLARVVLQAFDSHSGLEGKFLSVESAAAGDFGTSSDFDIQASDASGYRELIQSLGEAIQALPMDPSLLLVFDTFEQVQVQGRHAVNLSRVLLDAILKEMPFARIIVSGRGDVQQWDDQQVLELEDLDAESANSVLEALGVGDSNVRVTVIERLGTNPLTLRLVADGWKSGRLSADDVDHLIVGARSLELQGHLYTRILGHIQDGEVRRLAHPGLVVRRITKGVLTNVLGKICDIKPERVDVLLQKLPNHVTLFDPDDSAPGEGEALRHRQDVRETMLRLMVEDVRWRDRLMEIHSNAIAHYETIAHPIARAEELYHRLMRDDDPEILDNLWSAEIAASLSRSWGEPFPERAALWLGLRLGQLRADAGDKWRVTDCEVIIAREAESHLASGDAQGAIDAIRATTARSPGSRLYAFEARALLQLDKLDDAINAAERGLSAVSEASYPRVVLELFQLAARISFGRKKFIAVQQYGELAIRLATALEETNTQLIMLDLMVRADREQKGSEKSIESAQQLERLFIDANEQELRSSPTVSEHVVHTLGATSKSVLRKAALTFGNREQQDVIDLDAFKLEKLLERADGTDGGKSELSQLARQVGLPSQNYQMIDLAGAAIRYGRMGDALAVVLNHVGNDENVRLDMLSMFNVNQGEIM